MYVDSKRKRVLMKDGTSLVDENELVRNLLLTGKTGDLTTIKSVSSDLYEERYHEKISINETINDPHPNKIMHKHTIDDMVLLETILYSSDRFNGTTEESQRIEMELEFFDRTENILFILYVKQLIEKFRDDGVVWGVGRGSSCSSYIMCSF